LDFVDTIFHEITLLTPFKSEKENLYLGRLSIKEEAAGKARVFAITDVITQTVMRPLNDSIFKILDSLPMDGTFDQDRPIRHLRSLYELGKDKLERQTFYSYDLSAATDRLPISLQEQVISLLIGERMGSLWRSLLTERD